MASHNLDNASCCLFALTGSNVRVSGRNTCENSWENVVSNDTFFSGGGVGVREHGFSCVLVNRLMDCTKSFLQVCV